jgi:SOS-response transcriptional repressor LexA
VGKKSTKHASQAKEIEEILRKLGISTDELAVRVAVKPETMRKVAKGYQKASSQLMHAIRQVPVLGEYFDVTNDTDAPITLKDEVRKAEKPLLRKVPVVSWVRAGEADYNYDDLCNYLDETLPTDTTDPNAFAVIVEGDSMEPKFSPGDRLILTPNIAARNGDLVIARLRESGAVLFKRFFQTGPKGETIKLTSYNPVYPEMQYHLGEFRFIYRVHQVIHWPNR